jgi:hypothetical protein
MSDAGAEPTALGSAAGEQSPSVKQAIVDALCAISNEHGPEHADIWARMIIGAAFRHILDFGGPDAANQLFADLEIALAAAIANESAAQTRRLN